MWSGIPGLYCYMPVAAPLPASLLLRRDNHKCFQMLLRVSRGQNCMGLRATDLNQTISFKVVTKEGCVGKRSRLPAAPGGDSRCRSGRASVSTAPALSGQRPGRRGRSGSSPRAWTHVPGASCTSSPAAGCKRQRRSAERALHSWTVSKARKIGRTHEKQLGISNGGFLKL